ncbi:MAG: serine/threonine protein kinase [Planctomycetes bacterium]|nr:serine/threonine protein kinase [Planctomycetota bacterium]
MVEESVNGILDPEAMQGQEIAGCRIVEKLATGGMGTVYRALQVSMNRQVAIKCLAEDFARDKQYVARFVREARAAGELSHTHLIHVLDVGVHQGVYYYIMEFVDGQSLDRILKIKGKLGPETVTEILIQGARALSYAHSHEIIHRDIKPDNLMITKEGTVKIADLGIAKKLDPNKESTDAGLVLGTPNYMAPEQAQDASLTDRRSDIYALGSTAYHMLSGSPPYTGKNALEVLTNVVKKRPVPIEKVRPGLPKGLLSILNRMMARDPEKRYQSMDLLLKDLEAYKAGKYQEPKAAKSDWDDDEDDVKKPAVPLEIAETAEETAAKSAVLAASVAASSDHVSVSGVRQPSGSRIVQGAALNSPDLVAAKALGAIQGKQKSMLMPILTLLGALAVLAGGYIALKKLTQPAQDPGDGPRTVPQQPDEPGDVPGESEAKQMLDEGIRMERTPGTARGDVIRAYDAAYEKWPDTPSGKQAHEASERIGKEWTDAVEARIAESRKLLPADEAGSFAPAYDAIRKARVETAGRPDFLKLVQAMETELNEEAGKRAGAFLKAARERGGQQDWEGAISVGMKVLSMEVGKYADEAMKLISDWRGRVFAERETAMTAYERVFVDACTWARGTKEEARGEMRFDKAIERLTAAANDAALKQIRKDTVEPDLQVMKDAASVVDEAYAQARSKIGEMWQFTKETFPNNKKVKILDVKPPLIVVEFSGRSVKTNPLVHDDILKLAQVSLNATVEGKAKLAAYLFVRGEIANAKRQVGAFQDAVAQKVRARIDEYRIRSLTATKTWREMQIGDEIGAWKAETRGNWELRDSDREWMASGAVAERLLMTPPDEGYIFEVEARRDAGPNGCAIYFLAWGGLYQWHVGDAGNKYSIVRGLPATRTDDTMVTGDPVLLRVVVLDDKAIGYINGARRWEFVKTNAGSPDPGPGTGIGAINTLVRFRRVRLLDSR